MLMLAYSYIYIYISLVLKANEGFAMVALVKGYMCGCNVIPFYVVNGHTHTHTRCMWLSMLQYKSGRRDGYIEEDYGMSHLYSSHLNSP